MAESMARRLLMNYFKKKYEFKYRGNRPFLINRNIEKWAANDLLDSYGMDACKQIIDRYFVVNSTPEWNNFTYNAQKVYDTMLAEEADKKQRKIMQKQAEEWIEQYG